MNENEVLIESNVFMQHAIKKVSKIGLKVLNIQEEVVYCISGNINQIRYKIFAETLRRNNIVTYTNVSVKEVLLSE